MAKKSKQKQKNKVQKKLQPQAQAAPIKKTVPEFTITVDVPQSVATGAQPTVSALPPKVVAQNQAVISASDEYIKTDIRRIVLTLAVLVAILIATVIVNDRSTSFQTAGNHLASFLKLQ